LGYVAVLDFTDNQFWIQAFDYLPYTWISSLKVADVNGDSINELVVGGYSWDDYGNYYFYIGIATNQPDPNQITWLDNETYSLGENEDLYSIDASDIDGDGVSEILASGSYYNDSLGQWDSYEAVYSWSNTTDMVLEDTTSTANDQGYSVITADLNNDTQPEVISCNTLNTGTPTGQIEVQTAANYVPDVGSVTGVVSDNTGPVSGATVKMVIPRYSIVVTTTTLANGSFTFTDLQPRSYDVEVYAEGRLNQTRTSVSVTAGETTTVQIQLQTTVVGAVTLDNVVSVSDVNYHVMTFSNSTVTNLTFSKEQKEISFNVTGQTGTGFCNVTIPYTLLNSTFTVKIDGVKITPDPITTSNSTHWFVYFHYTHSTHKIQITGTTAGETPTGGGFDIMPVVAIGAVVALVVLITAIFVMRGRRRGVTSLPPPPPPP
jgi:hypothetical protein